MKAAPFLPLFIIIISCAPRMTMRQTIYRDEITSLEALSTDDREIFDRNWRIAEELMEQDRMAWIATDSLVPKLTDTERESLRGYVVEGSLFKGDVFFFSDDDIKTSIIAAASFSNGIFSAITKGDMNVSSRVLKMAKCLHKARAVNKDYIANQRVNYNTYSLANDSGVTVYLAPGSVDGYLIFGGGIVTKFDKNLDLIENIELHKSIIAYGTKNMGDVMARTSSITPVLNEIDIMQYLIWKNIIYNQMIVTAKYGFILYNVPDEGRIIKRVFTQEDMKKK